MMMRVMGDAGYGDVNQQAQVQDYNKMYVVAQNQAKAGITGLCSVFNWNLFDVNCNEVFI